MKVLFSVRHATYVRHYESVLRLLASRGHEVTLASDGTIRPVGHRTPSAASRLSTDS